MHDAFALVVAGGPAAVVGYVAIFWTLFTAMVVLVLSSKTPEQWEAFIRRYPRGRHALDALAAVGWDIPKLQRAVVGWLQETAKTKALEAAVKATEKNAERQADTKRPPNGPTGLGGGGALAFLVPILFGASISLSAATEMTTGASAPVPALVGCSADANRRALSTVEDVVRCLLGAPYDMTDDEAIRWCKGANAVLPIAREVADEILAQKHISHSIGHQSPFVDAGADGAAPSDGAFAP